MYLSFDDKYAAIKAKDPAFEGTFFLAVKSTGIFCRPTCRARTPLRKNVEFFDRTDEALANGYRPCKKCKPLELPGETPSEIKALLDDIAAQPDVVIKDQDLRERDLNPATIRRWFKKHHNMTFQAYQRMLRLNLSYQGLAMGNTVTETAFANGYESLSGFETRFKDILGHPPSTFRKKGQSLQVLVFERFSTPLGPMMAIATDKGLCLLEFTNRRMLERELKDLQKRLNGVILPGQSPFIEQTKSELEAYFDGRLQKFTIPLVTPGTEFQQKVWRQLQTIPYGKTRSYKAQATRLKNPKAVRAVATANGMNRIAIIIPCHRVIGSDGSLVGYAGGLQRKEWLLEHEKEHAG